MQFFLQDKPLIPMTKLKQTGITLMVALAMAGVLAAENPRIATVDMQKLFRDYYRTNEAQERFNLEYANIQKEINQRIDAIGQLSLMIIKLEREISSDELTGPLKDRKESELAILKQKRKTISADKEQYEDEEKRKVTKLKQASIRGIMNELRQKVREFAEREGYDFMFDKSGKNTNQVSFFIYLKGAQDVTSTLLEELNSFAPGKKGNEK